MLGIELRFSAREVSAPNHCPNSPALTIHQRGGELDLSQGPLELLSSAIYPDGAWIFNKTTQSRRGVQANATYVRRPWASKAWAFMMGTMPTCIPRVIAS